MTSLSKKEKEEVKSMQKKIIVISLGGSLIFPNGGIDTEIL